MTAVRVDVELVRRGIVPSRGRAAALVAAGRVTADGRPVFKAASAVTAETDLAVEIESGEDFPSRAAYKLLGALEAFDRALPAGAGPGTRSAAPSPEGAWCLDVGASTGGFTDVLLRRGARHVVALDVGHGQLVASLRDDPRVTMVEGYNARHLCAGDLAQRPDFVVADVSFISLRLLIDSLAAVGESRTSYLLMVKPQFEVGRERLSSTGVVRSLALREGAVTGVVEAAATAGLRLRGVVPSVLPGPQGNREFFVWLDHQGGPMPPGWQKSVHRAVTSPEGNEVQAEIVVEDGSVA